MINEFLRKFIDGMVFVFITIVSGILTDVLLLCIAKRFTPFRENDILFTVAIVIIYLIIYGTLLSLWLSFKRK